MWGMLPIFSRSIRDRRTPSQPGKIFGNKMFAYCLVHWRLNKTSRLYFGAAAAPKGEVHYAPIVQDSKFPSFYYIRVLGISVGVTRLPIDQSVFEIDPSSGTGCSILDSGSLVAWFFPKAYDQILAAYKSQVKYPISTAFGSDQMLCFETAGIKNPSFPTMEIHLDGAHLRLPTPNTFFSPEETVSCLAILQNDDPSMMEVSIIGNLQQQDYDIVFDLKNKKIWFSTANCASM